VSKYFVSETHLQGKSVNHRDMTGVCHSRLPPESNPLDNPLDNDSIHFTIGTYNNNIHTYTQDMTQRYQFIVNPSRTGIYLKRTPSALVCIRRGDYTKLHTPQQNWLSPVVVRYGSDLVNFVIPFARTTSPTQSNPFI
jgi:hypothetical protein